MSINRGMDEDVVHIYNEILLIHEKEQNKAICSNMNGPRNRQLSEVSQREKDRYMILLIYGILKNGTNELTYKTEIESQM